MYIPKTPAVVKALYNSLVWNLPRQSNNVYFTFDDGPHPDVTEEVLTILDHYECKATFFCVGDNIRKHPETFARIKSHGHGVGNHTFNHLNGWETSNITYYRNIIACQYLTGTPFLRPPYGKITRRQASVLGKHFKIIMWDVLSGDFDAGISKEKCLDNVVRNLQPGSIVVFHDSEKAAEKMLFALPRALEYCRQQQWKAAVLNTESF